MKAIIITGTPGTGKTTVAKELSKRFGFNYIDVNDVIKKYNLSEGYDDDRMCEIVDTEKLKKVLISLIKRSEKRLIIDSHLSHFLPKTHVKLCIITKCCLSELKRRLKQRGYSEKKIRENLDADIFDVCFIEAKEAGHKVIIVETDKNNYDYLKKDLNNI